MALYTTGTPAPKPVDLPAGCVVCDGGIIACGRFNK